MTRVAIPIAVLEAAVRLVGPDFEYEGMKLVGPDDVVKRFGDDVIMVCEALMKLVEGSLQ